MLKNVFKFRDYVIFWTFFIFFFECAIVKQVVNKLLNS